MELQSKSGTKPKSALDQNEIKDDELYWDHDGHDGHSVIIIVVVYKRDVRNETELKFKIKIIIESEMESKITNAAEAKSKARPESKFRMELGSETSVGTG
ncbi:hypothetical protein EVAR_84769_1 [Eumeta japonica]|uniref:Uncharacterized protein n=1 Tax=Eumeta variegata TaxID=151549 RepID=A0A4C1U807_EUMVA|nr:hypothetical protein EVAR_84769_1 [Eumeta japonica]